MAGRTLEGTQADTVNLPLAAGFIALEGVATLVEELRGTIGDEACSRIKAVMLARLAAFPLSDAVRAALRKDVDRIAD